MSIVRMTRAHLSDVAELEKICFSEPWSESALELLLGDAAIGYVCEQDGRAVAYVGMLFACDEGQITNVAVHPNARRQGIGRRLMEAIAHDAQERGLVQIALEVRVSNDAAVQLYEKDGFVIAGRRLRFYRDPTEDAFVMVKAL